MSSSTALKLKQHIDLSFYNNVSLRPIFWENVPIKKICGMSINCNLMFSKKNVSLQIESTKIFENEEQKMLYTGDILKHCPKTLEDYILILKELNLLLKNIKFNKYNGYFETESINKNDDTIDWYSVFEENDNVELEFCKCCICLEMTITKTTCCKQNLCYECWDKLPLISNKYDIPEVKCPLCRLNLCNGEDIENN